MKGSIWFLAFLLALLCFGAAAAQSQPVAEFYQTETPPQPQLTTELARDAQVFQELKIPAVLAMLKYELTTGAWPKLAQAERNQLLAILTDPTLKIIYTGQQSTLAHSSGGQTIDKTTIKFHQDGFYAQGAPRSPYELAKIILHEVGHVHQERYNTMPRPLRTKEWFPEELETQLLPDHFTSAAIDKLAKQLAGEQEPANPQPADGSPGAQSVVLLFDASGSMGDASKIDKAKAAARNVLWKLDENTPIALIVFYDCGDIRVEQEFTTDARLVRTKIDQIIPTGSTPLADGIAFAKQYIQQQRSGKARLVILSDGEESCSGDPVKAAQQ